MQLNRAICKVPTTVQ